MSGKWYRDRVFTSGAVCHTAVRDENHLSVFVAYGDTVEECEYRRNLFDAAPEMLDSLKSLLHLVRLYQIDGRAAAIRSAINTIAHVERKDERDV